MRVAAIQLEVVLGDVVANLEACEAMARSAASEGAELIVLPEFFTTGVGFLPELAHVAVAPEGAATRMLCSVAAGRGRDDRWIVPVSRLRWRGPERVRTRRSSRGGRSTRQGPSDGVGERLLRRWLRRRCDRCRRSLRRRGDVLGIDPLPNGAATAGARRRGRRRLQLGDDSPMASPSSDRGAPRSGTRRWQRLPPPGSPDSSERRWSTAPSPACWSAGCPTFR